MTRKVSGFSLIEMAIVLVIIGLVGGITLPFLKVMVDRQKASTTTERQEKVLYALASYALLHGSLPNAASPTHLSGEEDKESQLCRGIIPYVTLGLPESFAKDGYHHWLTYVVEKKYTEVPSGTPLNQNPVQHDQSFCRFIKKSSESSEVQPDKQQTPPQPTLQISIGGRQVVPIAVAVVSHGPEGRGAPNSLTLPHEGDERKNTEGTMLVDRPVSQNPQNHFSHKIMWATARNLMGVYGQTPCPSLFPANPRQSFVGEQAAPGAKTEVQSAPPSVQPLSEQEGKPIEQCKQGNTESYMNLTDNRKQLPSGSINRNRVGNEEY